MILAGISAGAICWFEESVSDSVVPGQLAALRCLGFLPGSACPHYDGEPERRGADHSLIAAGCIVGGYAADDGLALHFVGTRLEHIVSSRPGARAYRVERQGDGIMGMPFGPHYLGPETPGRS